MEEKKSFSVRYREWKKKIDDWGAEHGFLGFPIRHPTLFLLTLFVIVFVVMGACNMVARSFDSKDVVSNSSVSGRRLNAGYRQSYLFSDGSEYELYWVASDGESGTSYDGYFEDFNYDGMFLGRYLNIQLLNDYCDVNYPDLSFTFSLEASTWYDVSGAGLSFNSLTLRRSSLTLKYSLCNFTGDTFYYYSVSLSDNNNGFSLPDGYLRSLSFEYNHDFQCGFLSYFDSQLNTGYYYQEGYDVGYSSGYAVGKEDGYSSGYAVGKEDGFNLGNSSDMTLTTLFWNVIDEPFAVIYRLLNFDVLGVNVFAFCMGFVTIGIIGFVIKLII